MDLFSIEADNLNTSGEPQKWHELRFFVSVLDAGCPKIELDPQFHALGLSTVEVSPETVPTSTSSGSCFDLLRRWMYVCQHEHELCDRAQRDGDIIRLPTRFVNIRGDIRLVENASRQRMDYATLTHRWTEGTTKMVQSNLDSMKEHIDLASLSPIFQDSIATTRRLKIG